MNDATLKQAMHMLSVFAQAKRPINTRALQGLLSSKLLALLRDACLEGNPAMADIFAFRHALGLPAIAYAPFGDEQELDLPFDSSGDLEKTLNELPQPNGAGRRLFLQAQFKDDTSLTNLVQLYAINACGMNNALEIFRTRISKEKRGPANRSQLVAFAKKNTNMEVDFSGRIVGLGSCLQNEVERLWQYPYIEYREGRLTDCGTLHGEDLVGNGSRFKTLFLACR